MRIIMATIISAVLSLTLFVAISTQVLPVFAKSKNKEPFIVKDEQSKVDYCSHEPLMSPCYGREITVENPLLKWVRIQFDCGPMYISSPKFEVPPRVRVVIDVTSDQPGSMDPGQCRISEWKVSR